MAELYGHNVYRTLNYVLLAFNVMAILVCGWSVYCCLDDYYDAIMYLLMFIVLVYNTLRTYYLIRNSDAIWNCMDFASVEFLTYGRHGQEGVLRAGRARCANLTNFFATLWAVACVYWMIPPLLNMDFDRDPRVTAAKYRLNVFNFLYPVSQQFYNDNFTLFYVAECIVMAYNTYVLILYDVVIVSFCITTSVQLETVSGAFKSLGYDSRPPFYNTQGTTRHTGRLRTPASDRISSLMS